MLFDLDLELRRSHPIYIQDNALTEEDDYSFPSELRKSNRSLVEEYVVSKEDEYKFLLNNREWVGMSGSLIEENLLNKDDFDVEVQPIDDGEMCEACYFNFEE